MLVFPAVCLNFNVVGVTLELTIFGNKGWSMFLQDVGEVITVQLLEFLVGRELSFMKDHLQDAAGLFTLQFLRRNRSASTNSSTQSSTTRQSPGVDTSDAKDPAYYQAETLRVQAEALDVLFTSGEGGGPNWNDVMSRGTGGCEFICNSLGHVLDRVQPNHRHAGNATTHAIHFARRGIEVRFPTIHLRHAC